MYSTAMASIRELSPLFSNLCTKVAGHLHAPLLPVQLLLIFVLPPSLLDTECIFVLFYETPQTDRYFSLKTVVSNQPALKSLPGNNIVFLSHHRQTRNFVQQIRVTLTERIAIVRLSEDREMAMAIERVAKSQHIETQDLLLPESSMDEIIFDNRVCLCVVIIPRPPPTIGPEYPTRADLEAKPTVGELQSTSVAIECLLENQSTSLEFRFMIVLTSFCVE